MERLKMARPRKDAPIDLSQAHELTAGLIERLKCPPEMTQAFLRDSKAPGLRVRVTPSGFKSFVFEAKLNQETIRCTIGDVRAWRIDGPEGTPNARSEANMLRVTVDRGDDPRALRRQSIAAAQAKAKAKEEAANCTLKHLLDQYCDHLETLKRDSHKEARSVFKLHVYAPWPDVSATPANEVTSEQIADMMRRVLDAGKGRTANKLRTYAGAAYQIAKSAKTSAAVPLAFKAFNVRHNPAADTSPDEASNKSAKNPLTLEEMRTYWKNIKGQTGFRGALLRLHLLTGGQRIEQLVRLKTKNIDGDMFVIYDGKGRPGKPPREHAVPLIAKAFEAMKECRPKGEFALSTNNGKTHVRAETLSGWASEAAAGIDGFQTKRIRSGVETLLAKRNFSRDHRGHLQSHGISGVQARHYDGHDYLNIKRAALVALLNELDAPDSSNVIPMPAKAA